MFFDILACVRVKVGENEGFKIDSSETELHMSH